MKAASRTLPAHDPAVVPEVGTHPDVAAGILERRGDTGDGQSVRDRIDGRRPGARELSHAVDPGESQQPVRCANPEVALVVLEHVVSARRVHPSWNTEPPRCESLAVELVEHRPPSAGAHPTCSTLRNRRHVIVRESVLLPEAGEAVPRQLDDAAGVGADPDGARAVLRYGVDRPRSSGHVVSSRHGTPRRRTRSGRRSCQSTPGHRCPPTGCVRCGGD